MKSPRPPDPVRTAEAQAGFNREAAMTQNQMNMVNQTTPFGSLQYQQVGYWEPEAQQAWQNRGQGGAVAPSGGGGGNQPTWVDPRTGAMHQGERPGRGSSPFDSFTGGLSDAIYQQRGVGGGGSGGRGGGGGGSFDFGDYTPRYEAVQTLSPEMQAIVDNLMGGAGSISGQLRDQAGKPLDFSDLPGQVSGIDRSQLPDLVSGVEGRDIQYDLPGADDFSGDRLRVEEALYERLNPQIERDRAALETKLFNQGIMPGSEAYREALAGSERNVNDLRTQVTLAGGQEQSRLFNMALQSGVFANSAQAQDFDQKLANAGLSAGARAQAMQELITNANMQNQARQQGISEQMLKRQTPINELSAMLQGTQLQQPSFVNTPQANVAAPDYAGQVQANYQQRLQQQQNTLGGLFGLGQGIAGMLPFSDERLKENKRRIGKTDEGTPIYTYNYKGDDVPQIGVMAQELEKKRPDAVHKGLFGLRQVDYSKVA